MISRRSTLRIGRSDGWINERVRQTGQRLELLRADQLELGHEIVEVLVAGVAVRLGADRHESIEVMDVDVHENPKQPTKYLLADADEVLRERDITLRRKDVFVVDLALDPVHQTRDVARRRQRRRLLVLLAVHPQVLELRPARHPRTRLVRAIITNGAVNQIDAVEEVDDVHGDPIAQVLTCGAKHRKREERGKRKLRRAIK